MHYTKPIQPPPTYFIYPIECPTVNNGRLWSSQNLKFKAIRTYLIRRDTLVNWDFFQEEGMYCQITAFFKNKLKSEVAKVYYWL